MLTLLREKFSGEVSSNISLSESYITSPTYKPLISLTVEPAMDNLTITTIPTTSRFPTTFTPQTVTTVLIAAAAGGVVLIVLLLVIILLVIMRCRKIFKNRESEMRDGRTERDSLVEVSNDSEMKTDIKYHAARILTESSAYGQQTNKDKEAQNYAEQNYVVNKYEQVPSDKLWYKKGTAPAISGNRSVSPHSYERAITYEKAPPSNVQCVLTT